jgi:hypothetical protein
MVEAILKNAYSIGAQSTGSGSRHCQGRAGSIEKAIEIALDVKQLINEVSTFLNAASMMHRVYKT